MSSKLIYLASPYSAGGASVLRMQERFEEVSAWAAKLMERGHLVFSPIAHSHPVAMASGGTLTAGEWQVWQALDFALLDRCDELWVVNMEGWAISVGVRDEIVRAYSAGKPCYFVHTNFNIYKLSISDGVYRVHWGEPRKEAN